MKKIKVMTISDHPLSPSGVGTQTKYFIEALLKSGKFSFICLGGAIQHKDKRPQLIQPYGEDWTVHPVDGYGDPNLIRAVIKNEKPDILWFMTDPRFYEWLWAMENEIRVNIPMVYYHVWDNYPYPKFNKKFYDSNDLIVSISKVTDDIVRTVSPDVDCVRIGHVVDPNIFKKYDDQFRLNIFGQDANKFILFYNGRNARRKMTGTLIYWFKEFIDKVGHDKSMLVMHTDPKDQNGQDLEKIIVDLGLTNGQVNFSTQSVSPEELGKVYSSVDLTVNISDAEGFGCPILESLSCATPVLVNMTGGPQEQVTDGKKWFGKGITPASRAIVGSQQVPYIYEDRLRKEDFLSALNSLYKKWKTNPQAYKKMGENGQKHVHKNYNFKNFEDLWVQTMLNVHEKHGSWESRKNYCPWELKEV